MDASSRQWIAHQLGVMEVLDQEYNASVSSETLSSCTTDDVFIGKIGSSREVLGSDPSIILEQNRRPSKLIKTCSGNWGSSSSNNDSSPTSSTCHLLSFSNPPNAKYSEGFLLKPKIELDSDPIGDHSYQKMKESPKDSKTSNRPLTSTLFSQEHVIAERKRREKLSQKFIALSALVPGLKKMDKASVLLEAARYIKQLQNRVRTLEEKAKQQNVKAVILKRSLVSMDINSDEHQDEDANSSISSNQLERSRSDSHSDEADELPEIQAKVMDMEVLLTIHCEKRPGLLTRLLNEMEKFGCCITSSNAMPFGNYDLDITVTAQMKAELGIRPSEIVRKLRMIF